MNVDFDYDIDIEEILSYLNAVHLRCTYGAVGKVIGVPSQSVGEHLGARRKETSWVVNKITGEPAGYAAAQKHPQLNENPYIISSGDELAERLREHRQKAKRKT